MRSVLWSRYGFERARIAATLAALLRDPKLVFSCEGAVSVALALHEHSQADFVHGLHATYDF
jgi:predicted nucleic-acid-binding protein